MRALTDDRNSGSTVVVWDRNDYMLEAEKQLSDANV